MRYIPDFLADADNVYRTKEYIVKQILIYHESETTENCMMSFDTYYRRTPQRDYAYLFAYRDKDKIDGKRIPSTMYTRNYVE